jgi:cytochrome c oxidase subunit 2
MSSEPGRLTHQPEPAAAISIESATAIASEATNPVTSPAASSPAASGPGRTATANVAPPCVSPTWGDQPDFGASATKWSLRGERRYDPRALPAGMQRRLLLAALAAALAALLIAVPSASADWITPESGGSQNADDIDTLYKITLYVGLVIFLIVEGTLIWSLVRYRARRNAPEAAQIRGNTPLELGWTMGAALILVVLTVVTFIYLPDIENPPPSGPNGLQASKAEFASIDQPDPPTSGGPILRIKVNGQQYLWRYDYQGGDQLFSYQEMVVPTDTTVVLEVSASDVIHSWWIPKLGGKVDAVPGHVNETWFKIPEKHAGTTFDGQCAELCGANHADMRARVVAMTPREFEDWAEEQRAAIKEAGEALAEQREQRESAEE